MDYLNYLVKEIHTTIAATVDHRDLPVTCAIDMMDSDDCGLYFLTARGKGFYKRLKDRGYIALTGLKGADTMSSVAVSIRGKVREIGDVRLVYEMTERTSKKGQTLLLPEYKVFSVWTNLATVTDADILRLYRDRGTCEQYFAELKSELDLERLRRQPEVAVKVAEEQDRELRDTRLGVVVNVPIWDRRKGPVAEATALLSRSRSEEASQQLMLVQALEGAYREYEIARTQVNALENGILREAESTMKVAEAAYRFGERGILEYLDAQRVFRAARNELIAARYALQLAVIEIERLRAPQ